MKNIFFLLFQITVITSVPNQAKAQDDNLKPVNGVFSEYNYEFDYYSLVRKILFQGFSDNPEARLVIIPSFSPESALDIEKGSDNNTYYLIYHKANPNIWYSGGKKKINVDSIKAEIDLNSFWLIKTLFLTAINKVKYESDSLRSVGTDGTNYYFSVSDMGQKEGVIWSPAAGSKMNRLVEIGTHLIQLMSEEAEVISFDTKFSKEIMDLTKILE
jgi:hypothetical protein